MRFNNILSASSALLLTLFALISVTSCGPDSNKCAIDGRFLKMNQGEFHVYSPDGAIEGIDTIAVQGGRFEYEAPCHEEGILVIVLPNFYELPVFMMPGKEIKMRADATHIRDIEITGTDANEMMTQWRSKNSDLKGKALVKSVTDFVNAHPTSVVSRWLLYKYIMADANPDHKLINTLATTMLKAAEKAGDKVPASQKAWLVRLVGGMKTTANASVGDKLPVFTVTDVHGKTVKSTDYMKGYAVITLWSENNYESQNINRQLRYIVQGTSYGSETAKTVTPKVLSISIDPSARVVRDYLKRDSLPWSVVCDEQMWQSDLVRKLGFTRLPDDIVVKDGRIIARTKKFEDIRKLLE